MKYSSLYDYRENLSRGLSAELLQRVALRRGSLPTDSGGKQRSEGWTSEAAFWLFHFTAF